MNAAATASNPNPENHALSQATAYAERSLAMMRKLAVAPTPHHFSLFFSVAAGHPPELLREVETAIAAKRAFDAEYIEQLYTDYIADDRERVVGEGATNAKRILTEMLAHVQKFGGDATEESKVISKQIEQLNTASGEEMLRMLAMNLMTSAAHMQDSSANMSVQLAGAQQEILELRENLARLHFLILLDQNLLNRSIDSRREHRQMCADLGIVGRNIIEMPIDHVTAADQSDRSDDQDKGQTLGIHIAGDH